MKNVFTSTSLFAIMLLFVTSSCKKEEEIILIVTDMDYSKLENFKNEWEEKWNENPSIPQDEPGILTSFPLHDL